MAVSLKKILYCGSGFLGAQILEILCCDPRFTVIVFLNNTHAISPKNKILKICQQFAIRFIVGTSVTKLTSHLKEKQISIVLLCSYGELLPQSFLDLFLVVNIHPSLLPKYRGATPIVSSLLNNEKKFGISIMKIVKRMDAGNLYVQTPIFLHLPPFSLQLVYERIKKVCQQNLGFWITAIIDGRLRALIRQNDDEATYCWKFKKNFNKIDLNQDAAAVVVFISALAFYYKPFLFLNSQKVIICKVGASYLCPTGSAKIPIGGVIKIDKSGLIIKCREGNIKVTCMQIPGRRPQSSAEFYNGYHTKYIKKSKIDTI